MAPNRIKLTPDSSKKEEAIEKLASIGESLDDFVDKESNIFKDFKSDLKVLLTDITTGFKSIFTDFRSVLTDKSLSRTNEFGNLISSLQELASSQNKSTNEGIEKYANGGMTSVGTAIVGEGQSFNKETAEIIKNPTNAPLEIIPLKDFFNSLTVNNKQIEDITKDIPQFAGGSGDHDSSTSVPFDVGAMSTLFSTISSGGRNQEGPENVVSGVGQGLSGLFSSLSSAAGPLIAGFTGVALVAVELTAGFNTLAKSVGQYSADITMAQTNVELRQLESDMKIADEQGPRLAAIFEQSNTLWIDIKEILVDLSSPLMDLLIPVLATLKGIIEYVRPFIKMIADFLSLIVGGIYKLISFGGGFNSYLNEQADSIFDRLNNRARRDDEINPVVSAFLNTLGGRDQALNIAAGGVPTITAGIVP